MFKRVKKAVSFLTETVMGATFVATMYAMVAILQRLMEA